MTDCSPALMQVPGDIGQQARDLAQDLDAVYDVLNEIASCWPRAQISMADRCAGRPLHLQEAVWRIESDVRSVAEGGPGERADLALRIAGQFNLLRADMASAQSMTLAARAVDTELLDSADDILRQAASQALGLVLAVSPVTSRSVNRIPLSGASKPWLVIELG